LLRDDRENQLLTAAWEAMVDDERFLGEGERRGVDYRTWAEVAGLDDCVPSVRRKMLSLLRQNVCTEKGVAPEALAYLASLVEEPRWST